MDKIEFGSRLRQLRRKHGLTQANVKEALTTDKNASGISMSYLSQIEGGTKLPSLDLLERLAFVYLDDDEALEEMVELEQWLRAEKRSDMTAYVGMPAFRSQRTLIRRETGPPLELEQIDWALRTAITDPRFPGGQGILVADIAIEDKLFIISLYEKATELQLLDTKSDTQEGN